MTLSSNGIQVKVRSKSKSKVKVKGQELHRLASQTSKQLSSQHPIKPRDDFQVNARPKPGRLPSQSQSQSQTNENQTSLG